MRFSVWPINQQPLSDVLAVARHSAAAGWDGVWVSDHLMPASGPTDVPVVECWTTMVAIMTTVPEVRVGSLVLSNTFRHPGVLAKMAATLDAIDPGRLVLGLGAGWAIGEHEAYGIDLPPPAARLRHLDEACHIVRALLADGAVDHVGERYQLDGARASPLPAGRVPLLIGVKGDRALRLAARHADEWNIWASAATLVERSRVLAAHCDTEGRDPDLIVRSAQAIVSFTDDGRGLDQRWERSGLPLLTGSPEQMQTQLGAYAEAGLDEFIVPDFGLGSGSQRLDALDRFLADAAAPFRRQRPVSRTTSGS